jgi:hypothetical protein
MKFLVHTFFALVLLASNLSAQIIYSGEQNLVVGAIDSEGIYINFETGAIETAFPVDFYEAPWINITLGGYGIFNGEGVEGFASIYHAGEGPGQFVPGEPGIVGFEFTKTSDSTVHYGWLRLEVGADGNNGVIVDWAYENTAGEAIQAGAVPEPSTLGLIAIAGLGGMAVGRRRARSRKCEG